MSDSNPRTDFNAQLIDEFRANAGKVGGGFAGAPMVLLHTTGAKSGKERVNPLVYLPFEGRMFVFASKGGAPTHPDWYRNLVKNPSVTIEVGEDTFPVTAVVLEGPERDRIFAEQVSRMPPFGDYEKKTGGRVIPVIELKR